jgi:hypothetical protein
MALWVKTLAEAERAARAPWSHLRISRRIRAEYPDEPLIPWLLRFRAQRPCANEATNDFYEFPPLHGFPPS